jgi:hypothetical protein
VKSIPLFFLFVLALAVGGCASVGGGSGPDKVYIGDISDLPQMALSGASMQQARSVAMAAAQTKGWDIVTADANRLLLERPLPPGSPQAQALPSPLAPPRVQVETNLVQRGEGTIVALRAYVLTNPGTPEEQRLDYTKDYENQLLISLSSLSSAWLAAGAKLNSEVPVLAQTEGADDGAQIAGGDLGDVAETVASGADAEAAPEATTVAAAEPESATPPAAAERRAPAMESQSPPLARTVPQPPSPPVSRPAPQQQTAPVPSPSAVATAGAPGMVAPTIAAPNSPTTAAEAATPSRLRPGPGAAGSGVVPAPVAPSVTVGPAGSNEMLVLSPGGRKGLWSYYAEDFARLRGCTLGDRGAMLLQERDGFELHEVECVGTANVLVRCRGGICEPLR